MFVWFFLSNSIKIPSFNDVIITGKGLNNFTYIRHSWPLSSDCSLTCNNYCDKGQPIIMVISEDP